MSRFNDTKDQSAQKAILFWLGSPSFLQKQHTSDILGIIILQKGFPLQSFLFEEAEENAQHVLLVDMDQQQFAMGLVEKQQQTEDENRRRAVMERFDQLAGSFQNFHGVLQFLATFLVLTGFVCFIKFLIKV